MVRLLLFKLVSNLVIGFQLGYRFPTRLSQFPTWLSVITTKINLRSYRCLGMSRLGYGRRIRYLRGLPLASTSKIWLL